MSYSYVINPSVFNVIDTYYTNVATKFGHTYSFELLKKNISDAYAAIYSIENGLQRRRPTISRWNGLFMASYKVNGKTRWNFAYRIEDETIYVEDACHAQNMHESKTIRLTESQFRIWVKESIKDLIKIIA